MNTCATWPQTISIGINLSRPPTHPPQDQATGPPSPIIRQVPQTGRDAANLTERVVVFGNIIRQEIYLCRVISLNVPFN
jgi:hypothetical protein